MQKQKLITLAIGVAVLAVVFTIAICFGWIENFHSAIVASLPFLCLGTVETPPEVKTTLKEINDGVKDLTGKIQTMEKGHAKTDTDIKELSDKLKKMGEEREQLEKQIDEIRRRYAQPVRKELRPGQFVSDECASLLASIGVIGAHRLGKLDHLGGKQREHLVGYCTDILKQFPDTYARAFGPLTQQTVEQRSTLTTSDIPLPTNFSGEVVELVWKYGQARQFGTIYPLGTATTKLPRLKTSPAFGFLTIATAIGEKSPQFEFVTFSPEKAGGIVRFPSEIEADSIVPLGQFLARYIGRETAKWEDTVFFTADGSGTYKSMKGVGKAALDLGFKVTLASTKTKPSDITLADLRALRAQVATGAYANSRYYFNRTMEALLVSFNTSSTVTPYIANGPGGQASLDGWPIEWVDVLPIYDTSAHASQLQALFGDLSFTYMGVRSGLEVAMSNDVYFTTDELAIRALERFCIGLMADQSAAVLQLAAS